jgi:pyrroline-5-carboxylate reductase
MAACGQRNFWFTARVALKSASEPVYDFDQRMQCKRKSAEKAQHRQLCEHFEADFRLQCAVQRDHRQVLNLQTLTKVTRMTPFISFIGGGNMARALAGGLLRNAHPADRLCVSDPNSEARDYLATLGICVLSENTQAIEQAQVIVLAVKPQALAEVAHTLATKLRPEQLVISIAAGVRIATLRRWLNGHSRLVRAMPNTPALVQAGATGLYAPPEVSADERGVAESILRAVGVCAWVNSEALLDSVTALSGSGPAYAFLVMEAMQAAGEKLGLDSATARLLTLETMLGAARLALESNEDPAILRARVTSPGGTTERGLAALKAAGLRSAFAHALDAARARAEELANLMDQV